MNLKKWRFNLMNIKIVIIGLIVLILIMPNFVEGKEESPLFFQKEIYSGKTLVFDNSTSSYSIEIQNKVNIQFIIQNNDTAKNEIHLYFIPILREYLSSAFRENRIINISEYLKCYNRIENLISIKTKIYILKDLEPNERINLSNEITFHIKGDWAFIIIPYQNSSIYEKIKELRIEARIKPTNYIKSIPLIFLIIIPSMITIVKYLKKFYSRIEANKILPKFNR
jgi:hypothetical protein